MDAKQSLPADPVELVHQLDADAIQQRLVDLDHERDALRVLLRAALRTQRKKGTASPPSKGGPA
jgi:hypothetical protein